jgi:hypothetical protein
MSTNLGYSDTPILSDSGFHVHDGDRPQPRIIWPGYPGTQEASGQPPSDAFVLFGGSDLSGWSDANGGEARWYLENEFMQVSPGTGDIQTRAHFGDCQLHLEFASPWQVKGDSQGRGNSGVFMMGLYEIQVLDCFDNLTYADGTTGAIYGQYPPLVNACRKPGEWQNYDIIWTAPRFEGETLKSRAVVTVVLNGVLLHYHKSLQGPTQHRNLAQYRPQPAIGPLKLQDHGDLVRYRNIWYRPLGEYDLKA